MLFFMFLENILLGFILEIKHLSFIDIWDLVIVVGDSINIEGTFHWI